jgi:hypothetical protein
MRGRGDAALGEGGPRRSRERFALTSALLPVGSLLLAGCATGTARPTAAATATEPDQTAVSASRRRVRLEYAAPAACPGSDAFADYIESRSPRLQVEPATTPSGSAPAGILTTVTLTEAKGRWLGEVRVDGSDERRIEGEHCADVVSALALIAVLRLDAIDDTTEPPTAPATPTRPNAPVRSAEAANIAAELAPNGDSPSRSEQPSRPDPAVETRTSEPRAEAVEQAPEVDGDEVAATAAPLPRAALDADEPTEPGSTGSLFQDPQVALTLHAGYASTPSDAIKAALGVELGAGPAQARWSLGLSFAFARGSQASAAGDVTLDLLTAELALCPFERSLGLGRAWLRACAQLRAGALAVSLSPDQSTLLSETAWRPWFGVGPSLELGLPLSSSWTLRARTDVAVHTIRDAFVLERTDPDTDTLEQVTLYEPELFSLGLSVGAALTF